MSDDVWTCDPPASGVVVTLSKPFVATLPGGRTVVLPAGTTMREVPQAAVELRRQLAWAEHYAFQAGEQRDLDALNAADDEVERLKKELAAAERT